MASACQIEKPQYWYTNIATEGYIQESRIGRSFVAEVFFSHGEVIDAIDQGDPSTDDQLLTQKVEDAVQSMRSGLDDFDDIDAGALDSAEVAASLSPNVLSVQFEIKEEGTHINGLALYGDDAFDPLVRSVLGRSELNDQVERSRIKIYRSFPYLQGPRRR